MTSLRHKQIAEDDISKLLFADYESWVNVRKVCSLRIKLN
jgi:hypothetical protein